MLRPPISSPMLRPAPRPDAPTPGAPRPDAVYDRRRAALVDDLRARGVRDARVLAAIGRVERHRFVPDTALLPRAYRDEALPIGLGQTISQPYTVAYQTSLLDVRPGDRILEVGTGSGYQAAVLRELGAEVWSVERHAGLAERTTPLLAALGYHVHTRVGDGTLGWEDAAPFDGIVVTAGGMDIPPALLRQLRVPELADVDAGEAPQRRGGVLVIPVGGTGGQTMQRLVRTSERSVEMEEMGQFRFVPLVGGG